MKYQVGNEEKSFQELQQDLAKLLSVQGYFSIQHFLVAVTLPLII